MQSQPIHEVRFLYDLKAPMADGVRLSTDVEPPIKLFVMGRNEWRHEHEWPLARTAFTPYYLHSGEEIATGTRMEVARQTVLHSSEYPSHILLPVIA